MGQLTSTQLSEWEAYDRLDPIGSWRDDFRMASIEATLTNIHNAANTEQGKEVKTTTPGDFLPIWDEVERNKVAEKRRVSQSLEEMRSALMAFASSQNKSNDIKEGLRNRKPTLEIKKKK